MGIERQLNEIAALDRCLARYGCHLLDHDGQTVFAMLLADGTLDASVVIYVGKLDADKKNQADWEEVQIGREMEPDEIYAAAIDAARKRGELQPLVN